MEPSELRKLGLLFGRFARPHWPSLAVMSLVSVAAAIMTGLQPVVLAPAVDTALWSNAHPARSFAELNLNNLGPTLLAFLGLEGRGGGLQVLAIVVGLYLVIVATSSLLNYAGAHLMRRLRTIIANDIQAAMYQNLLSLSMPFFVSRRLGELASRFHWDVARTAESFDPIIRGVMDSSIQLTIYGLILFKTDPYLALTVGGLTLFHVGVTRFLQKQIRERTADSMEGFAQVSAMVQEALLAIRVVKSFSAERFELERLRRTLARLKKTMIKFSFYASSEYPLRELTNAVVLGAALLASFAALSAGRLTLPGFVLFVVVARQAILPFANLNTAFIQLQVMIGASRHVVEILEARPTLADGAEEAPAFERAIALEAVCFEYHQGLPVLQDVSLEIPRGRVVAVVGPSGTGKSTLADLVLRLQDPTSGRVLFDGADVRRFSQASYRRHFGVVPQEPILFNATIEENIAYGRQIVAEEVEGVARIANAEEFVQRLPEGYKTFVGDRGIRLSGGQRQRIAIARALYGHPDILILDEATSSLDSEAERLVQQGIDQAVEGSTALVIAHRLSTIIKAHRIVVLDGGRVEASGSHTRLLETSPLYQRLYAAQFREEERVAP